MAAALKIMAGVVAIAAFLGVVYAVGGRWVRCPVYAEDMSAVKSRQLQFEERNIQAQIYDTEDRLANPKLPEKRRGVYEERLRKLNQDKKEIEDEKAKVGVVK
jgi:uncharacterized membrane protein